MKTEILRLTLAGSISFTPHEGADPYDDSEGGESLFCFELESSESLKFEPDPAKLLGPLNAENSILPAGQYMFSQARRKLSKDEILEMAVEIQKETLWQRLIPDPQLYLRYLYEDGRNVTQVFRPYKID